MRQFMIALGLLWLPLGAMAQPAPRLSDYLLSLLRQATGEPAACRTEAGRSAAKGAVDALLTLRSGRAGDLGAEYGLELVDSVGRIYIVRVPIAALAALGSDERVERVEAERAPLPAMDDARAQVSADAVLAGRGLPQAFDGTGVAAGVFDCGFDYMHPAFVDAEGHTRIRYACDFTRQNADGTTGGELWERGAIEAEQHSPLAPANVHGTHVAGIMAGSPVDGRRGGVAQGAELYLAEFRSSRTEFSNDADPTSATVILGFKRLFDRAEQEGRPCVVNFSNAETEMMTNERRLEGEVLSALVGPGRIIVAAAGNFGGQSCYLHKTADRASGGALVGGGQGGGHELRMDVAVGSGQRVDLDFLGPLRLGVQGALTFHTDSVDAHGGQLHLAVGLTLDSLHLNVARHEGESLVEGRVYTLRGTFTSRSTGEVDPVFMMLYGARILFTGAGEVTMISDLYVNPLTNQETPYDCAQPGRAVTWPATLPQVVSVGAMAYRYEFTNLDGGTNTDMSAYNYYGTGRAAGFSSMGPTLRGLLKPDAVAPGTCIEAAFNSHYATPEQYRKNLTYATVRDGRTYYMMGESGTSMASPVAAGVVALWLQARPELTPAEVQEVLAHTSTHPDPSLPYPNVLYGHGQVDAYAGLLYVLGLETSVPQLSRRQPAGVRIDAADGWLHLDFDAVPPTWRVAVYALDGRAVLTARDADSLDLEGLPAGVYAVQVTTPDPLTTGSTLIRLRP